MKFLNKMAIAAKTEICAIFSRKENSLRKDNRGEAYVGEAIKILIAVVVGALVLSLVYALIRGLFPTISQRITDLFNYTDGDAGVVTGA